MREVEVVLGMRAKGVPGGGRDIEVWLDCKAQRALYRPPQVKLGVGGRTIQPEVGLDGGPTAVPGRPKAGLNVKSKKVSTSRP